MDNLSNSERLLELGECPDLVLFPCQASIMRLMFHFGGTCSSKCDPVFCLLLSPRERSTVVINFTLGRSTIDGRTGLKLVYEQETDAQHSMSKNGEIFICFTYLFTYCYTLV